MLRGQRSDRRRDGAAGGDERAVLPARSGPSRSPPVLTPVGQRDRVLGRAWRPAALVLVAASSWPTNCALDEEERAHRARVVAADQHLAASRSGASRPAAPARSPARSASATAARRARFCALRQRRAWPSALRPWRRRRDRRAAPASSSARHHHVRDRHAAAEQRSGRENAKIRLGHASPRAGVAHRMCRHRRPMVLARRGAVKKP